MTQNEKIEQLSARAKEALKELCDAIADAAPAEEKDAVASRLNAILTEIEKLDGWASPKLIR